MAEQSLNKIRVVAGAFYRNKAVSSELEVLVFERQHKGAPGTSWEFPGGKVEKGESDSQALVRELEEEIGIKVQVKTLIGNVQRLVPSGRWIDLWLYLVEGRVEAITLTEHLDMKWIAESNLNLSEISWVEQPLVEVLFKKLNQELAPK